MGDLKHLSVHQWIRSAIPDSQQPTSPIGFLFLKLPPPPCAVLLVQYCILGLMDWKELVCSYSHTQIVFGSSTVSVAVPCDCQYLSPNHTCKRMCLGRHVSNLKDHSRSSDVLSCKERDKLCVWVSSFVHST